MMFNKPEGYVQRLKLSEIQKATKNFDESLMIARGCFGPVYKGEVSNVVVAIKRLNSISKIGAAESWPEVEHICHLRHRNLVSLIGYVKEVERRRRHWWLVCSAYEEKMETILVYEYIPNGTLKDHLHVLGTPLSWLQRLNICIGVAHGLLYLHKSYVMHGDVRSCNILLTESWTPKLSDFGLSKLGPTDDPFVPVFTIPDKVLGCWDPYSLTSGKLTMMSDVYSLGVVLLEVLCRKPALDESRDDQERALVSWVQHSVRERDLEDIVDSDIRNEMSPTCLKQVFGIALRCLERVPQQRPQIDELVDSLEALKGTFNTWLHSGGMVPSSSNSGISIFEFCASISSENMAMAESRS